MIRTFIHLTRFLIKIQFKKTESLTMVKDSVKPIKFKEVRSRMLDIFPPHFFFEKMGRDISQLSIRLRVF
ncbi:MAG: hypothetical protein A2816_02550 [Candidatus Yanofskybacteria bacterium RIFCSPHIGHO2_01_FULL_39_44]|nr:MAG: hypothetical protein A2816_02550 [Candidatus Yanofskybacteria bacterium RIFCSPHIGHO2_01_FULL_39_44]